MSQSKYKGMLQYGALICKKQSNLTQSQPQLFWDEGFVVAVIIKPHPNFKMTTGKDLLAHTDDMHCNWVN